MHAQACAWDADLMSWIGACTRHKGWFHQPDSDHISLDPRHPRVELLPQGTLTIEARVTPENRPQTLLSFERCFPWPGQFSLQVLPGGSVVMIEAQGRDTMSAVLPCPYVDRTDIVRLSYSWNALEGFARLAIERPEPDSLHMVHLDNARPMILTDLRSLMTRPHLTEIDADVMQIGLSDSIEPVGPRPGLLPQSPIMTDQGERFIHTLKRGDLVRAATGDLVPVLHVIRNEVPAQGVFRPVCLRAGYFGLKRDLVVSADQRVVMHGSDVEYMFGHEAVAVPARHLINDRSATYVDGPASLALYQLILPNHEAILASGCPLESMYIGRIRRHPERLSASVLSHIDRSLLPEHARPVSPVLKPFEAISLASARAA